MIITGNYGLPVPPDSLKFGGSSHFRTESRSGSVASSGRNSPVHLPAYAWEDDGPIMLGTGQVWTYQQHASRFQQRQYDSNTNHAMSRFIERANIELLNFSRT